MILPAGQGGSHPQWSRDGKFIAFSRRYPPDNFEICVCRTDGSDFRRLTNNPALDSHPTWAPDSQRLAFASNRLGNFDLYAMNLDRTGLVRLTHHGSDEWFPNWSVTDKIAYVRGGDIFVMNSDGSGQTNLTASAANEGSPAWAPIGDRLVYNSDKYGNRDVFTIKSDGSDRRRLTFRPADEVMPSWGAVPP